MSFPSLKISVIYIFGGPGSIDNTLLHVHKPNYFRNVSLFLSLFFIGLFHHYQGIKIVLAVGSYSVLAQRQILAAGLLASANIFIDLD